MTKYVYVQVHGVEKPARIEADEVVEDGSVGQIKYAISIKLKKTEVGKFHGNVVDGWWIQDERE